MEHAPLSPEARLTGWVREHASAVRGYLLGLVRRADVADDLMQEVFRRAWQARDRYRDEGHERAFLLKIADRLVIDRSRRLGFEVNLDEPTWHEIEPSDPGGEPRDQLSRRETNEELAAMLDQLSLAQRQVLLMQGRRAEAGGSAGPQRQVISYFVTRCDFVNVRRTEVRIILGANCTTEQEFVSDIPSEI